MEKQPASEQALEFLRKHEELRLRAYDDQDPGNPDPHPPLKGKLTIGYGHTGPDVHLGVEITEAQAEALLRADADKAAAAVWKYLEWPLNDTQMAALTCLVFNIGAEAFMTSTMRNLINNLRFDEVSAQFDRWVYGRVKGKAVKMAGLVKRRADERALFESAISKQEA
jgi:lysozyme